MVQFLKAAAVALAAGNGLSPHAYRPSPSTTTTTLSSISQKPVIEMKLEFDEQGPGDPADKDVKTSKALEKLLGEIARVDGKNPSEDVTYLAVIGDDDVVRLYPKDPDKEECHFGTFDFLKAAWVKVRTINTVPKKKRLVNFFSAVDNINEDYYSFSYLGRIGYTIEDGALTKERYAPFFYRPEHFGRSMQNQWDHPSYFDIKNVDFYTQKNNIPFLHHFISPQQRHEMKQKHAQMTDPQVVTQMTTNQLFFPRIDISKGKDGEIILSHYGGRDGIAITTKGDIFVRSGSSLNLTHARGNDKPNIYGDFPICRKPQQYPECLAEIKPDHILDCLRDLAEYATISNTPPKPPKLSTESPSTSGLSTESPSTSELSTGSPSTSERPTSETTTLFSLSNYPEITSILDQPQLPERFVHNMSTTLGIPLSRTTTTFASQIEDFLTTSPLALRGSTASGGGKNEERTTDDKDSDSPYPLIPALAVVALLCFYINRNKCKKKDFRRALPVEAQPHAAIDVMETAMQSTMPAPEMRGKKLRDALRQMEVGHPSRMRADHPDLKKGLPIPSSTEHYPEEEHAEDAERKPKSQSSKDDLKDAHQRALKDRDAHASQVTYVPSWG